MQSKTYRDYVLLVLTGVYTFNFIDRQILVILQESIKADLGLSDTQLGLLTGFAFALFYVTLGIPIARFADRSNRKNIIAVSLTVWSAMTALSGFVQNFWQLLLARIGVGVGEAGGSPPAHSIISDYFPAEKRATALSIYSMGIYIGILFGYLAGGWINQYFGWRMAFMAIGIPGVIYALVVFFTVKEPVRGQADKTPQKVKDVAGLIAVTKHLLSYKTFVYLAFACGLTTFGSYGVGNFTPPFLARVHGLDSATIGTWLSLTSGIGGGLGTFLGGYIADKLGRKDVRWYLWISIIAGGFKLIPATIFFFSENAQLVLIATFFSTFAVGIFLGPSLAVIHNLVTAKMRAFASAILFFVLNLIGLGFGPMVIGMLSDFLEPTYQQYSLRWAFTITYLTGIGAMFLYYKASQHYTADLAASRLQVES